MGLVQDVIIKVVTLFIRLLAHFGQPYLFKILLSPQFFPSPQQLEELIGLHPGATVLNLEHTLDPRNIAGEIGQLSGGLVKVPTIPTSLDPKALEGELGQLSGGLVKVPTTVSGLPLPVGGPSVVPGELIGALGGLPAVGNLPGFGALPGATSGQPGAVAGNPAAIPGLSALAGGQAGVTSALSGAEAGGAVVNEVAKSGLAGLLGAASGGLGALTQAPAPNTDLPGLVTAGLPATDGAPLTAIPATGSAVPDATKDMPRSLEAVPAAQIGEGVAAQLQKAMGVSNPGPATPPLPAIPATPTPAAPNLAAAGPPKSVTGFSSANPGLDEFLGNTVPANASPATIASQTAAPAQTPAAAGANANLDPMNLAGALGKVAEGGMKNASVVGGGGLPWTVIGKKA